MNLLKGGKGWGRECGEGTGRGGERDGGEGRLGGR